MRTPSIELFLKPNNFKRDRKLQILICPNCGALVVELKQFNIPRKKYETIRPKAKKASKFLLNLMQTNSELKMPILKTGTSTAMNWIYGLNIETKKEFKQYAVDFNGVKKITKIIPKS